MNIRPPEASPYTVPLAAIALVVMAAGSAAHYIGDPAAGKGTYLGEHPPGLHPVPFAPAALAIPGKNHHTLSFSADGRELYFSRYPEHTTLVMREANGEWTPPEPAPWNGWEAIVSPGGKRIVFGDGDLWISERTPAGWDRPRKLPPPVNSGDREYYASLTAGGSLYFSRLVGARPKIFRSRLEGGQYRAVEEVFDNAYHPFISPDERYIVFNSFGRNDGRGAADLYVAFSIGGGAFSPELNLGPEINSPDSDLCPTVSPGGEYLFFTRLHEGTGRPFWVSAQILKSVRSRLRSQSLQAVSFER